MKKLGLLALTVVMGHASAATLVSSYDFNNTLNPVYAANANVMALDHRTGNAGGSSSTGTGYFADTVGTTNKMVAQVTAPEFFRANHGIGKNGGGDYVNQYSLVLDVKTQGNPAWVSLWNTTDALGNDGESFLRWDGNSYSIGISGTYMGAISANAWHRIVITVNCAFGGGVTPISYYVDGGAIHTVNAGGGVDGRWSMYSWDDPDVGIDHADVFGDNDGDNLNGWVSQVAFFDGVLSPNEVGGLGGVGTEIVPEPASFLALGLGALSLLRRKR